MAAGYVQVQVQICDDRHLQTTAATSRHAESGLPFKLPTQQPIIVAARPCPPERPHENGALLPPELTSSA